MTFREKGRFPKVFPGPFGESLTLAGKDRAAGRPMTPATLYKYACDRLRLDFLVWDTEEPYGFRKVLPFLHRLPVSVSGCPGPGEGGFGAGSPGE